MEINVGDYVRDKNGRVGKVFDITNEPSVDVGIGIIPEVNAVWIDKDKINYLYQEEITKHSKDIIDLIEVGDYVNGVKVHKIFNENGTIGLLDDRNDGINFAYHDGIKEVLTKEQYEREVFRV